MWAAGPARTVRCRAGDALGVACSGHSAGGPFARIVAPECLRRDIAGRVTNGPVRDGAEISVMGLPIFARGLTIRSNIRAGAGEVDASMQIGGPVSCRNTTQSPTRTPSWWLRPEWYKGHFRPPRREPKMKSR
jgi:regulator of RNase E activity RraA